MRKISTREAYGQALKDLGEEKDFVVMDADLSKATQTKVFAEAYPNRFYNIGIAEGDMIGTAAGFASTGIPVFASTFAMFAAGRAYEQIRNAVCYNNLNVKIGATHAGILIGEDGASHQCVEDIALMRVVPNMTVLVPCDEKETRAVVRAALEHDGPVYIRLGRGAAEQVYTDREPSVEIGKGQVLRDGTDLTIVAVGDLVADAVEAADILEKKGISAAVIDMVSVKPLDERLVLEYADKTGKLITAEDHSIIGGLGGAVSEVLAQCGGAKQERVGVRDRFGASGKAADLKRAFALNAEGILEAASRLMGD